MPTVDLAKMSLEELDLLEQELSKEARIVSENHAAAQAGSLTFSQEIRFARTKSQRDQNLARIRSEIRLRIDKELKDA